MSTDTKTFLVKLQEEAALQSKLQLNRWLPEELDAITSTIGKYPWQVILVLSGVTSLLIELMGVGI